MLENKDVNDIDLDSLFADDSQQEPSPVEEETAPAADSNIDNTKAFAKRLRESTDKARAEERESIAKAMGYGSYDELTKSRERKVIEDKGLDPDDVAPIVEQLVKERIDKDPRMQELEELRQMRVQEFGKKELAEVTKLSGGEITSLNQLSPEVISAWKQKGSLKAAYLEVEGEKRIMRMMGDQSRGTTTHLTANGGSAAVPTGERNLTADEKKMYKFFNPSMTDDQLNKITVKEN